VSALLPPRHRPEDPTLRVHDAAIAVSQHLGKDCTGNRNAAQSGNPLDESTKGNAEPASQRR
jgi:hypothetical protein